MVDQRDSVRVPVHVGRHLVEEAHLVDRLDILVDLRLVERLARPRLDMDPNRVVLDALITVDEDFRDDLAGRRLRTGLRRAQDERQQTDITAIGIHRTIAAGLALALSAVTNHTSAES